jgi:C4-dicarboxylate-specific signal transduction histidine kinase
MSKMIIEENMGGNLSVKNCDDGARFEVRVNL